MHLLEYVKFLLLEIKHSIEMCYVPTYFYVEARQARPWEDFGLGKVLRSDVIATVK